MRTGPVRILYFSSFANFRYGGQRSLYHLVCNLDGARFSPRVIVPSEGELAGKLRTRGVAVSPVDLPKIAPGRALACWRALRRILSIIREGRFDVIHTDGPRNTLYGGIASMLAGIPLVWHIRSSDRDPYDRLLYRLCSNSSSWPAPSGGDSISRGATPNSSRSTTASISMNSGRAKALRASSTGAAAVRTSSSSAASAGWSP